MKVGLAGCWQPARPTIAAAGIATVRQLGVWQEPPWCAASAAKQHERAPAAV